MKHMYPLVEELESRLLLSVFFVDDTPGEFQQYSSIQAAVNAANPGDTIYIREGVYNETVTLSKAGTASDPIVIQAYPGDEGKVIISGTTSITNWRKVSGSAEVDGNANWQNMYVANVGFDVNQLFRNGIELQQSRYKDSGYLFPTGLNSSAPKNSFYASNLPGGNDYWNGAIVHVKSHYWAMNALEVTDYDAASGLMKLSGSTWYNIKKDFGYFITNIVGEIDSDGEWAYDASAGKLYMMSTSGTPQNIQASSRDVGIRVADSAAYNEIHGLTIQNVNHTAISIGQAHHITVSNNTLDNAFEYGIWSYGSDHKIIGNLISEAGSAGMHLRNVPNTLVEGNRLYNIGTDRLNGDLLAGRGIAIDVIDSDSTMITGNWIDGAGYCGIKIVNWGQARNRVISYNYVANTMLSLDDGAAIYMFVGPDAPAGQWDIIDHNIVENSYGGFAGTPRQNWTQEEGSQAFGIYLDTAGDNDHTDHVKITNNTVIGAYASGLYLHDVYDIEAFDNTFYGSKQQQILISPFIGTGRNLNIQRNYFYSTDSSQRTLANGRTYDRPMYGVCDYNYFHSAGKTGHVMQKTTSGPQYFTLSQWQSYSGFDKHSQMLPTVSDGSSQILYNATNEARVIDLSGKSYLDAHGNVISGTVSLDAFESVILIGEAMDVPVADDQAVSGQEDQLVKGQVTATDPMGGSLVYEIVDGPANGTVVMAADGSFVYTPNANYNGNDSFTFRALAGGTYSAAAKVTVAITPVNDAPTGDSVVVKTLEDLAVSGVVPASDVDGDSLLFELLDGPTNGSVTVNADGSFFYTPGNGFIGADSFTCTVSDPSGLTTIATVTIDVLSADQPLEVSDEGLVVHWTFDEATGQYVQDIAPEGAKDDTGTLMGDTTWTDGVTGGAIKLDGSGDYVDVIDTADINIGIHDKVSISLWFQVDDKNITGRKQVIYEQGAVNRGLSIYISDGRLYVGGWNAPAEESGWTGTWLSTDQIESGKWHNVVLTLDGSSTVRPDAFKAYLDGQLFGSGEGSQLWEHMGDLAIGDVDGQTLSHDGVLDAGNGFAGKIDDVRMYSRVLAAVEAASLAGTTVTPPPANTAPVADDQVVAGQEDMAIDGIVSASDAEGDALSYQLVAGPQNGQLVLNADGSFTYNPDADYNGTDSFQVLVNDGQADSNVATITLDVAAVNDAPVAQDGSITTDQDQQISGVVAGSDIDGDALSFQVLEGTKAGQVVMNADGSFTYTPDAGFFGNDSFTYVVTDAAGATSTATVTITVQEVRQPSEVSDEGLIVHWTFDEATGQYVKDVALEGVKDDTGTLMGDTTWTDGVTGGAIKLDGNGDYVDVIDTDDINRGIHDKVSISLWFQVDDKNITSRKQVIYEQGAVNRGLSIYISDGRLYVGGWNAPETGWTGTWLSTDQIESGQWHNVVLTLDGTSTIQPDAFKAYLDGQLFGSGEGSQLWDHMGDLAIGDVDGQTLSHDGVLDAGNGFAGKIDDVRMYSRVLTSGEAALLAGTTVTPPANTAPVADDQVVAGQEDVAIDGIVSASDAEGDTLSYQLVTGPQNGQLVLNADGSFTYNPDANYNGTDSFQVLVNDGQADSNVATITLDVAAVNDTPIADGQTVTTSEAGVITGQLTGTDVDGDSLSYVLVDGPSNGTLELNADGSFIYTPDVQTPVTPSHLVEADVLGGDFGDSQADASILELAADGSATINGMIDRATDIDMLEFVASVDGRISTTLAAIGDSSLVSSVRIFDDQGNQVAGAMGISGDVTLLFDAQQGQKFFVQTYGTLATSGEYEMNISTEPSQQVDPWTGDSFTFTVNDGQTSSDAAVVDILSEV